MTSGERSPGTLPTVTEAELRRVMTPARAVDVVRQAFRADGLGRATVPAPIDGQLTVVDLTGVGFQDTAIASAAYAALEGA